MRCVKRQKKKKIWHFPQYNFINGAVWSEMLKIFSIIQWHFLQYYYYELSLSLSLSLSSLAMPLSFSNTDLTMPHCQSHLELEIFVNRCFQVVAAIIAVVVVVFFWVVVVGVFFFGGYRLILMGCGGPISVCYIKRQQMPDGQVYEFYNS